MDAETVREFAKHLVWAGKDLHDAIDDDMKNESTALELALMTIGSMAEEHGIARFLRNGVENAKRRSRPQVEQAPVVVWCSDCRGHGCEACDYTGQVAR